MSDTILTPRIVSRAATFAPRVAIVQGTVGRSYSELLQASEHLAKGLLGARSDLFGERVALLVAPGFDHVAVQWAIWRTGGLAVPLAVEHPAPELARLIADARPLMVVADASSLDAAREAAGGVEVAAFEVLAATGERESLPEVEGGTWAMMIYTSGTTGRPKGVVTSHAVIEAQIRTLVDAWEWSTADRILHVLPLHHVHGVVNALACALWSGACCEFHPPGDAAAIWNRLASGEVSAFMAVPTMYGRLIAAWEGAGAATQARWSAGAGGLRLMVSGSAPLPVAALARWEAITGYRLLERYGMTEIGMALGNPLHGERRAGTVGQPFPGVHARIVDAQGEVVTPGTSGEIQVCGPQVFREYWQRPEETHAAFTADGWFRTGDEGVVQEGYWRIVGRQSIDIIKSGGYKVSALEVEELLRVHPDILEVAVVGVEDALWGERVCAAIVPIPGGTVVADLLRAWCKERMAPYKVPRQMIVVDQLPRNLIGKVLKERLRVHFEDGAGAAPDSR